MIYQKINLLNLVGTRTLVRIGETTHARHDP